MTYFLRHGVDASFVFFQLLFSFSTHALSSTPLSASPLPSFYQHVAVTCCKQIFLLLVMVALSSTQRKQPLCSQMFYADILEILEG